MKEQEKHQQEEEDEWRPVSLFSLNVAVVINSMNGRMECICKAHETGILIIIDQTIWTIRVAPVHVQWQWYYVMMQSERGLWKVVSSSVCRHRCYFGNQDDPLCNESACLSQR